MAPRGARCGGTAAPPAPPGRPGGLAPAPHSRAAPAPLLTGSLGRPWPAPFRPRPSRLRGPRRARPSGLPRLPGRLRPRAPRPPRSSSLPHFLKDNSSVFLTGIRHGSSVLVVILGCRPHPHSAIAALGSPPLRGLVSLRPSAR